MSVIETKLFHISSLTGNKNNGAKNSNISYYIPNFVNWGDDTIKAIYFSVLKCEFPISFYLINDYNNTLTIQTSNITTTYTMANGNYNVNTFITALSTLIGANYTITYNNITNKITISSIYSFSILYETTTMKRFLGLSNEEDTIATSTNGLYTITSSYVCNFLNLQRIHLRSSEFYLDSYNDYDKSNDIFLSIQNDSNNLGVIIYNNTTNLKHLLDVDILENISLRITDDRNREIDFNGVNWYLTFQVDYEYYEQPLKSNLSKFFKLYRQNIIEDYFRQQDKNTEN